MASFHTERLALSPTSPDDAALLFPIMSDPAGYWYDPAARHRDIERTIAYLRRAKEKYEEDGLSYWTVRLRSTGEVIGIGGIQRHASPSWNLHYRLASAAQGSGYATELSRAALADAARVDPTLPVIAWILQNNFASRRVADRLGLIDSGLGVDRSDGKSRLAYADRSLDTVIWPLTVAEESDPGTGSR